ncbi:MarR family winged helix-turn-helix transcriptional regulator [Facklamia miroungae]|uniref:DNA-binding transcriptional regulator, MarR family n=1 Tax=Facklamia miroungae TaxID=120956 RepID=A0A1G7UG75_9LACT|nr:MarR family transcriptional regulator [Facklamia miroungae]NKZ30119.1 MarR family transcriptional regulator [Facklamia miroungae]SDG46467.1 DNA-binding transcriptional regulator, MarR family [Facklamia miroungae]
MNLREVSKLFYQLKLANQEMITKFEDETCFSITRYELMMVLKVKGPCSQTTLQKELKIDRAAITRHLQILEANHFVIRERNKENNRQVFVQITNEALEALKRCEEKHYQANKRFELALSESEARTLLELLSKLVN